MFFHNHKTKRFDPIKRQAGKMHQEKLSVAALDGEQTCFCPGVNIIRVRGHNC